MWPASLARGRTARGGPAHPAGRARHRHPPPRRRRHHRDRIGGGQLSERELEVLRGTALDRASAEIADRLYVPVRTAGTHRARIRQRPGVRTRAELIGRARAAHLLAYNEPGR